MAGAPIKIQDVARIAGVSTATVSRTLHTPDVVSRQTRERVEQAVEETGYAGNAMARSLRRMETRVIVVLVPDIGNPFFSVILAGIESVASASGYDVLIGNTNNDPAKERTFANYVRGHQADGMLLLNGRLPSFADRSGTTLPHAFPPVVVMCERLPGHDLPTVRIDNVAAAKEATVHLAARGHRRIAHVAGPTGNILTAERQCGFEAGLRQAGLTPADALVRHGDFSIESGRSAARDLLQAANPPTAIFCANDEMAIGAMAELKASGCVVPSDISVVGFDDLQIAACYDPPLTTVRQPRHDIGRTAMHMMLDRLANDNAQSRDCVLPFELVVRASTAAPGRMAR